MTSAFDEWAAGVVSVIVSGVESGPGGRWSAPWHRVGAGLLSPVNVVTGAGYRGINTWQLAGRSMVEGWSSGRFATYKQWAGLDAQVRRGEKGTGCVRWVLVDRRDAAGEPVAGADGEPSSRLVPRFFSVFATEQVDGAPVVDVGPVLPESERCAEVAAFLVRLGADVREGGVEAFYSPSRDLVQLPEFGRFTSAAGFYATAAHEHVHWTGHRSRLDRVQDGGFGSESYALEELVAELGAALLMARWGLSTEPRADHAQYVAGWCRAISERPKALSVCATAAARAVKWMLELAGEVDQVEVVDERQSVSA